jgi:hypothetical protein
MAGFRIIVSAHETPGIGERTGAEDVIISGFICISPYNFLFGSNMTLYYKMIAKKL